MQRRNNAIKINSRQRHANNNKKEERVLNIFMIIMEIYQKWLRRRLHCPSAQSHVSKNVKLCNNHQRQSRTIKR